jgi:hypothetical protein
MNGCEYLASGEIELYFYGELDAREHAAIERHVKGCCECRRALDDLVTIRAALSTRPVVAAPQDGDWSGFMSKLDAAIAVERETVRVVPFVAASRSRPFVRYAQMAIAALVALATMSVVYVIRGDRREPATNVPAESTNATATAPASAPAGSPVSAVPASLSSGDTSPRAAFVALSEQHFERSKLVVLGLANKDARRANVSDWKYERQLASALLSDTRLYRLAAEDRGYTAIAKVMGDLELVLLQTSSSARPVSSDLQQIQRLIAKRDLISSMDAVTASGL